MSDSATVGRGVRVVRPGVCRRKREKSLPAASFMVAGPGPDVDPARVPEATRGQESGSNLGMPRPVKEERKPAGIPAPYGRVPRAVIRDCRARHPWHLMLERHGHRWRHPFTREWHDQQHS